MFWARSEIHELSTPTSREQNTSPHIRPDPKPLSVLVLHQLKKDAVPTLKACIGFARASWLRSGIKGFEAP